MSFILLRYLCCTSSIVFDIHIVNYVTKEHQEREQLITSEENIKRENNFKSCNCGIFEN